MDLDIAVGAPQTWVFAGRGWLVSGLTPYQIGQLNAFLKRHVPNPIEEVKKLFKDGIFTAAERKELLDSARQQAEVKYQTVRGRAIQVGGWPPRFGGTEASEILFNGEGIAEFLYVILNKHQSITRDEAESLAPKFGLEHLNSLMDLLRVPGAEDEADDDDEEATEGLPEGYVDPKV